jgi:signal transduction histidine kinase
MERILFVDDEQFVLDGFKRLLREYRDIWQIEFALNGKIALEMVNEQDFDVIITDIRMPEMPGLELLECLQNNESTKKIPVVVLTGDHDRTLKRKALELGAVDLLNKPVNKEDLVARINNVLKLKEYQDIILEKNRALERQLVISQKMDLVGVMAAGAVHDLSNLLSIIVGYSNLLIEEDLLDQIEISSMEKIRKAGEKASALVNQIVKFSRLEEKISIINVGDLIDDIISIVATAAPQDIKIVWEKPKENILMRSNAVKLQQVLLNLCINAIQAMEENGGCLTISLHPIEQDMMQIDVQDNGVGMDAVTLKKIFTPLFTTKEDGKGTGLGLFVVKHILDDYNGKIEVESEKGKGTLFKIFFPLFTEQSIAPPSGTDLIRIFGS